MAEEQPDELEVNAPGGFKIRARGYDLIVILMAFGVAGIAYLLWEHKVDAKAAQAEVTHAVQEVASSQTELSYLMTLTPDERSKLKLEMPESLRKRVRDR